MAYRRLAMPAAARRPTAITDPHGIVTIHNLLKLAKAQKPV